MSSFWRSIALKRRQFTPLELCGVEGAPEILVLDQDRVLTETNWLIEERDGESILELPPESVLLLRWQKDS